MENRTHYARMTNISVRFECCAESAGAQSAHAFWRLRRRRRRRFRAAQAEQHLMERGAFGPYSGTSSAGGSAASLCSPLAPERSSKRIVSALSSTTSC